MRFDISLVCLNCFGNVLHTFYAPLATVESMRRASRAAQWLVYWNEKVHAVNLTIEYVPGAEVIRRESESK